MPNVKEICKDWLQTHGYDGLCNDECGCRIDDLMACSDMCESCEAGYLLPGDADAEWYIGTKKPAQNTDAGNLLATGKVTACPTCGSNNVKCRGAIMNCEDCGERW